MKPLYVLIIAIVVAVAAFYGGMAYEKSKMLSFAGAGTGGNERFGSRFGGAGTGAGGGFSRSGGMNGMMPVSGQIVSANNNAITVKMRDGSSKIVDLSSSTKINKTTQGAASDLTTGQQVTAFGSTNSDGSITAQAVNVGNSIMFRPRSSGQGNGGQSGQQPGQ